MVDVLPPNVPAEQGESAKDGDDIFGDGAKVVSINHLHNHGNDIRELRKLAEVNPKLAEKVLDLQDKDSKRIQSSFRLGLLFSVILLVVLILGVVVVVIKAGLIALAGTVAVILATALLIRVILTGEWSETNWVGKIVNGMITLAGGKPAKDDPPDDKSSEA